MSFRLRFAVLLILHSAMLACIAWKSSPNVDEVGQIAAGVSHWQRGTFHLYRVNPPLVRMVATIPVVLAAPETDWSQDIDSIHRRPDWTVGHDFVSANHNRAITFFRWARLMCLPFSLLGASVCALWARDLGGDRCGIFAAILWCSSPNVLAWGATMNPDVGGAALCAAASYMVWKKSRGSSFFAGGSGLLIGLACLAKTTSLVLLPVWCLTLIIACDGSWIRRLIRAATTVLIAVYVINLGYGFEKSFQSLGNYTFISRALSGEESILAGGTGGNIFSDGWLSEIPIPLPRNYVQGMDQQKFDFERGVNCFLWGEWKHGGWYYYYLFAFMVKEPAGTVILALLTLLSARHLWKRQGDSALTLQMACMCSVFFIVSFQSGICRYLRYLLPAFPFVYLLIARACANERGPIRWFVNVCLLWNIVSCAMAFPHVLPYFNEFVGGARRGHFLLVDANTDWGHGGIYLREWAENHPERRPLVIDLYPSCDLDVLGLGHLPTLDSVKAGVVGEEMDLEQMLPEGWYAVSTHRLHINGCVYEQLREREPEEIVAGCIYIFKI